MASIARALLGLLVVGFGPGLLIGAVFRVRLRSTWPIAVAPAVSVAYAFAVSEVCRLTDLAYTPLVFFVPLAALAVLVVVRAARARAAPVAAPAPEEQHAGTPVSRDVASWASVALLVIGIVVGLGTWAKGLEGVSVTPPNFDASYHGYFTARIVDTSSVKPTDILVATPESDEPIENYYPLALHSSAAIAHRMAGGTIADLLLVLVVVSGAVVLPVGMFALARRLAPDRPLIAGFTALAVPMLAIFPYKPIAWGGIPLIVAMAWTPGAAVYAYHVVAVRWSVRGAVVAALAMVAVFTTHTSEVPVVLILLALLVVAVAVQQRAPRLLASAAARLAVVGGVSGLLLVTTLPRFGGGVTERSGHGAYPTESLEFALGNILLLHSFMRSRQVVFALVAGAGVVIALRRRWLSWWLVGLLGFFAFFLLEMTTQDRLARVLGLPWYHAAERVEYNLAFFLPVFVGVTAAALAGFFTRGRTPRLAALGIAVVAIALLGTAGIEGWRYNTRDLRGHLAAAPVGEDEVAAFEYLEQNVGEDEVVLNDDNADGSIWMYAFSDVTPLFFLPPLDIERAELVGDRDYLRDHIADLGRDPRVDAAVERYRVRYAYYDATGFTGARRVLNLDVLQASGRLRLVFQKGAAYVFRIEGG